MVLWRHKACGYVEHKANIRSMQWGRTKVDAQSRSRRPFWNCVASLEIILEVKNGIAKDVVFFHSCSAPDSCKEFYYSITTIHASKASNIETKA